MAGLLITFLARLEGCLGHRNLYCRSRTDVVYHLKYLNSHTSRSLSSYGSEWTRTGVSPFDTACWLVLMRMRNFMCMRSFNVSGPFEQRRIWRESR